MGDIIVIAALVLVCAMVIRSMLKEHKKGKHCSGCSGDCSKCSGYEEK